MPRKKKADGVEGTIFTIDGKEFTEEQMRVFWQNYQNFKIKSDILSVINSFDETEELGDWAKENTSMLVEKLMEFVPIWGDKQDQVLKHEGVDNASLIKENIKDIYNDTKNDDKTDDDEEISEDADETTED